MKEQRMTRTQLVNELRQLRQLISELQKGESDRKQAIEREQRLSLVRHAIRDVNQLFAREIDRDALLDRACASLVESRLYQSAWIAVLDESGHLVASAEAGLGDQFLPFRELLVSGPIPETCRRALAEPNALVADDPLSTCHDCPLAASYHDRAAMTVRLQHGARISGLMSVCVPRASIADSEERSVFEELAADVAFALHSIDREERRQREQQRLRQERDRAHRYLDLAGVIFVAIDDQERITLINRRACQLLGYSEEEVITENWFDTFLPDRLRDHARGVFQQLMAGEVEPVEYFERPVLTRSGEERIIAWHSTVLMDEAGNIAGTLTSGQDITERKQAERALKEHSQRLEEMVVNRSRELQETQEKLAVLPELEDLLGVISNAVYFLQVTLPEPDQKTKGYLDIISSGLQNAGRMVSQLLDLAQTKTPDQGKKRDQT